MLDLLTVVWGQTPPYRGLGEFYRDITLPSLMQQNNIPAAARLIGSYNLYSDESAKGIISQSALFHEMERVIPVSWQPLQKGIGHTNSNVLRQMHLSMKGGNHMLIIAPDWVVGNSSILNMAKLCAEGKYRLILFGFPKLTPRAFDTIRAILNNQEKISNRRLVSIAADFGALDLRPNSMGAGPVSGTLAQQGPHTWLTYHRCPNPCLIPDEKIVNFFSTNYTPNAGYSHCVPYWMIEKGYSWHYIDHSDTFFVAEEAAPWKGGSGPWGLDLLGKADRFFSQFQQIWRAA